MSQETASIRNYALWKLRLEEVHRTHRGNALAPSFCSSRSELVLLGGRFFSDSFSPFSSVLPPWAEATLALLCSTP